MNEDLRKEYEFDYREAKPNRFASLITEGQLEVPRAFHPAPGDSIETAENQPRTKLSETHSDLLEQLYIRAALSVEDLPYSDEMESLYRDFVRESGRSMTIRDVYEALKDLERQGRLSPPFPSSSGSPKR